MTVKNRNISFRELLLAQCDKNMHRTTRSVGTGSAIRQKTCLKVDRRLIALSFTSIATDSDFSGCAAMPIGST